MWAGWLSLAGLVACRVAPLVIWAPFLGGAATPLSVRLAVTLALTTILTALVPEGVAPVASLSQSAYAALALKELAIGVGVGALGSLMFWAVGMAGQLADAGRGASLHRGPELLATGASPVAGLWSAMTAAIFLALGGHLLAIVALARSLSTLPVVGVPTSASIGGLSSALSGVSGAASPGVGVGADWSAVLLDSFVRLTGEALALALLLALPVLASAWLTDLVMGLLQRTAPQLRAMMLGLSARALVGLLVVIVVMQGVVDLALNGTWRLFGVLAGVWPS